MIFEENQNNITKKIKYSSKINKKSKNNKKSTNNKKTNFPNTTNIMPNSNTNTTSNNINNIFILPDKLTKLTQTVTSQNTIQLLHKKITLIVNEAIASSSN